MLVKSLPQAIGPYRLQVLWSTPANELGRRQDAMRCRDREQITIHSFAKRQSIGWIPAVLITFFHLIVSDCR